MAKKPEFATTGVDFSLIDPVGTQPESGFFENVGAGVEQGFQSTSIGLLMRGSRLFGTGTVTKEEFDQSYYAGAGIQYVPGTSWSAYQAILDAHTERERFDDIYARADTGGVIGNWSGNFLGAMADPINLIPLGGGIAKAGMWGLGRTILREGAINVALEVPLTAAEFRIREAEQDPMSTQEAITNVGFAFALGGFFGALGHGVNRLAERAFAFRTGIDVDDAGNLVDTGPIQQVLPEEQPKLAPLVEPKGGFRMERLNDNQRAALTDQQLLRTVIGQGNTRPVEVQGTGLNRVVVDTETGEILFEFPRDMPISDKLASEIEGKLAKGETTRDLIQREQVLGAALRERAKSSTSEKRLGQHDDPGGVLLTHERTVGKIGKLHEVSVREYWDRTLKDSVQWGKAASDLRANADEPEFSAYNEVSTIMLPRGSRFNDNLIVDRLSRLTRQQFDYLVDHVMPTNHMTRIAKSLGVTVKQRDIQKRELGDLLWSRLHGEDLGRRIAERRFDLGGPKAKPTQKEAVQDALDKHNDAILTERLKKSTKLHQEGKARAAVDTEQGLEGVNAANIIDLVQGRTGAQLDKLAAGHPELAKLLREAKKMSTKKKAVMQAFACLLG